MLAGSTLTFVALETLDSLLDLALYLLVIDLHFEALGFVVLLLRFLIARIIYVHLVLFDAFAFAFLAVFRGICAITSIAAVVGSRFVGFALLLTCLALFALLLFGFLGRMSSLIDTA